MKFKTVVLCLKFVFAINHEQLTFFYKYDVIIDMTKVTSLTVFQRTRVQSAEITRFLKDRFYRFYWFESDFKRAYRKSETRDVYRWDSVSRDPKMSRWNPRPATPKYLIRLHLLQNFASIYKINLNYFMVNLQKQPLRCVIIFKE